MALKVVVVDHKDSARARAIAAAFDEAACTVWVSGTDSYKSPDRFTPAPPPPHVDLALVHMTDWPMWERRRKPESADVIVRYTGGHPDPSTLDALWLQQAVGSDGVTAAAARDIVDWFAAGRDPYLAPAILGGASDHETAISILSVLQAFEWLRERYDRDAALELLRGHTIKGVDFGRTAIHQVLARALSVRPEGEKLEPGDSYVRAQIDRLIAARTSADAARQRWQAHLASPPPPRSLSEMCQQVADAPGQQDRLTYLTALRDVLMDDD